MLINRNYLSKEILLRQTYLRMENLWIHQFLRKREGNVSTRGMGVKFQEVVYAKESWDTWVDKDPKHPTTSNA